MSKRERTKHDAPPKGGSASGKDPATKKRTAPDAGATSKRRAAAKPASASRKKTASETGAKSGAKTSPTSGSTPKRTVDAKANSGPTRRPASNGGAGSHGKSGSGKPGKSGKPARGEKISDKRYERALAAQQIELVKMQAWVKQTGRRVVILFEGRDAAGKGGTIKRITEPLNPRGCQVVALQAPTEREKTQWYFQRYITHLPAAGEIVIFDRSWYNRAGVERVMGFCTDEEYAEFMRSCPEFERMLVRSGIQLIKYWFSVGDEEQERRFRKRLDDPTTRWKLSPMDLESRARWADYSRAKDEMFAHTDIEQAPWSVVASDVKKHARLNCIAHLLSSIPYEDLTPPPIELGERPPKESYERPPMDTQTFVPEIQDKV